MSTFFYNYFKNCLTKEPPTATPEQVQNALNRGYLTQTEYDSLQTFMEPAPTGES
jgi:hypothetical protein